MIVPALMASEVMPVMLLTATVEAESAPPSMITVCAFMVVPKATARGAELTTATIIQRVADDRAAYEERNERKNKSEASYYELKSSGKVEKSEERG